MARTAETLLRARLRSTRLPPHKLLAIAKVVGRKMQKFIIKRFQTETDPQGRPWPPMSPATPRIFKARTGRRHSGKLGRATGVMYGHLISPHSVFLRQQKDKIIIEYPGGAPANVRRKLRRFQERTIKKPARKITPLIRKEQTEIRLLIAQHVKKYFSTLKKKPTIKAKPITLVVGV